MTARLAVDIWLAVSLALKVSRPQMLRAFLVWLVLVTPTA